VCQRFKKQLKILSLYPWSEQSVLFTKGVYDVRRPTIKNQFANFICEVRNGNRDYSSRSFFSFRFMNTYIYTHGMMQKLFIFLQEYNSPCHYFTWSFSIHHHHCPLFSPGNYGHIEPSMISHVRVCVCVCVCVTIDLITNIFNIFGTTYHTNLKFCSLAEKAIAKKVKYPEMSKFFLVTRRGRQCGSKRHFFRVFCYTLLL